MKDHRQSVVMATKYSNAMPGTDPNAAGSHRKSVVCRIELGFAYNVYAKEFVRAIAYGGMRDKILA
jgi:hypothetical protein